MIELPGAPVEVDTLAVEGNSDPIDVLGDRDGTATLVLYRPEASYVTFVFAPTDELIDAADAPSIPMYSFVQISKQTRYMTVFSQSAADIYWYVV